MVLRFLLACVLGGAQAVMACPSEMDAGGLVLTRTDPFFSIVLKESGQGLTEQRIMLMGGAPEDVSSVYPHPLVIGQRIGAETLSLAYSQPPSQLDRLAETGRWTSDVVLKAGGEVVAHGTATLSFIGETTISIGRCAYRAWQVDDRLDLVGRPPIVLDKFYAPALGVVLKTVRLSANREPVDMVEFDRIEAGVTF